jgi:hypothetical protein
MRAMRAFGVVLLTVAGLAGVPARAADPAGFDILTLRLYMPVAEVLERLHAQGIKDSAMWLSPPECQVTQLNFCAVGISMRARDGTLLIQFADAPSGSHRRVVYRIVYTIEAGGPANAATIRESAIGYYGPPSSPGTTAWCARINPDTGLCPADRPRLRVEPAPEAAALVTLSDDGLPARVRGGG